MKRHHFIPLVAAAFVTISTGAASAAKAGSEVFQGIVRHISTDNIKVYDPSTKQTLTFLLVPRFGNVFKSDGTTPSQMNAISAGQYVKVYYDQKLLGQKHADRILIMSSHDRPMAVKKS